MDDFKSALTRLIREADPTYIIGKVIFYMYNYLDRYDD
jgi:hypothetical protein